VYKAVTAQGIVEYRPLTYDVAKRGGEALLGLGSDNPWEYWTVENLLLDLPFKWELSMIALLDDTFVGYAIASDKGQLIHLHHLIVGARWRRMGFGRELLRCVALNAFQIPATEMSLKVYKDNIQAVHFYERYGFEIAHDEGRDLLEMRGLIDQIVARGKI
jgi:ribosomal protein S18 acetylase RimI-like enzyme